MDILRVLSSNVSHDMESGWWPVFGVTWEIEMSLVFGGISIEKGKQTKESGGVVIV